MPYFHARTFPAFDRNKPQTKAEQVVQFAQSRWRYVGGRFGGHLNVQIGRILVIRRGREKEWSVFLELTYARRCNWI